MITGTHTLCHVAFFKLFIVRLTALKPPLTCSVSVFGGHKMAFKFTPEGDGSVIIFCRIFNELLRAYSSETCRVNSGQLDMRS